MIGNRVYGSKREGIYRKLRPINHPAQEFADPHALCLSWQVSPWPVRCSDGRTHECGPSPSHPATPEQPRFSPDKKVLLQETSQAAAGTRPWRRLPPQGRPLWQSGISSFGCIIVWLYFHVNTKEHVWRLIKTYFLSFTIRTGGGEKGGAPPICWTCWQETTVPAITATAATFANEGYIFSEAF